MDIQVTARRVHLTPEVKEVVEEKTGRLSKYLEKINRVEVVLDGEERRGNYTVEIIVHTQRGPHVVSTGKEDNLISALDSVLEKVERQLKKFKGRKRTGRRQRGESLAGVATPSNPDEEEGVEDDEESVQ